MPVKKKEFDFDGTKIVAKQAGGMLKLKIENIQAKVFREFMKYGADPSEWTAEQAKEFADAMDEAGAGVDAQMMSWIPQCIIEPKDFDVDLLTSEELREILGFVRGDDPEGAIPLVSSSE